MGPGSHDGARPRGALTGRDAGTGAEVMHVRDAWSPPAWVGTTVPTQAGRPRHRVDARSVASRVLTVLLTSVLLYSGFVAYGTVVDNRWYKVVEIESGSMRPTLQPGDAVLITRPPREVEPGMVLVLDVDGRIVTHRVAAVEPDGTFVTKGDANRAADDFSSNRVRVVGQYRATLPVVGRLTPAR